MPFIPYDQNQSFLFPPDLNAWVTDDLPARAWSDVVDRLPVAGLRGAGGEGHPRCVMRLVLEVLVWACASGTGASGKVEDRLRSDVVFMWLAGRQVPDFRTICDFRRCIVAGMVRLFAVVLV